MCFTQDSRQATCLTVSLISNDLLLSHWRCAKSRILRLENELSSLSVKYTVQGVIESNSISETLDIEHSPNSKMYSIDSIRTSLLTRKFISQFYAITSSTLMLTIYDFIRVPLFDIDQVSHYKIVTVM